jgi:para-nitrobenzyl esterase
MIWVHGGGFVNGGTLEAMSDGTALVGQGLVFVSINYRLGRLGFFAHPACLPQRGTGGQLWFDGPDSGVEVGETQHCSFRRKS